MTSFDETLLSQAPLFQSLSAKESGELSSSFKEQAAEEGEVLFQSGDSGDSLYLVKTGHVELFVRDHTGQKVILKVAGPGDIFGELSLLDNGPRTASAMALEHCELAVLSQHDLLIFLRRKPEVALDLLAALGAQIRQTNDLIRGRVSRNVNDEISDDLTRLQKMASFIALFSGSMPFLFLNILFFAAWIAINLNLIPQIPAFDPYPFGFLTMAVSLEAIFLSIFVLVSQNLQSTKDKIRSDIEYQINIKAESEVAYLHEKVDQMNTEILKLLRQIQKSN